MLNDERIIIKKNKKKIKTWINLYRRINLATICIWFGWPRKESEGKKTRKSIQKKILMLKNKIEKNIRIFNQMIIYANKRWKQNHKRKQTKLNHEAQL